MLPHRNNYIPNIIIMLCIMLRSLIGSSNERICNDRMAAWQHTLVATDEKCPNSCLGTYINDRFSFTETYMLAKLVVGVEKEGETSWACSATEVRVEDVPGGVVATYDLDGIHVRTEITPLLEGRETLQWEGAAILSVSTEPPVMVIVKCGEGRVLSMIERSNILRTNLVGRDGDTSTLENGIGTIRSTNHPLCVALQASGTLSQRNGDEGGSILQVQFPQGKGTLILGFAKTDERSVELVSVDVEQARKEVSSYYEKLLQCRIDTPETVINDAFRNALITLEYTWVRPYGWIECIHHWVAMWHMQASGGAAWIGQADRARECILSHGDKLLPDGAVPQLGPVGYSHRDFGGSDQFFAWQVAQYWNYTGDMDSARKLGPVLDRVIQHTFQENDPENDGLLAWGQQIGNQEDYVSTPYNGTSPSIEGIQMLRTRASLARALEDHETERKCESRIAAIRERLKDELWQEDLGRFIFFKDPLGVPRLDSQYHTFLYPLIHDIVDPLDAWTSMRHLRERLVGSNGEIYCSNNFPNHVWGTWGMQAGVAQQPWGAWGLAAMGLRNEAYRPLKAAAEWAMNKDHRGSWPEVAEESVAAYFSPPAGLFVQSTVESLYGFRFEKSSSTLLVSPSFPDTWNTAEISLPDITGSYTRTGDTLTYRIKTRENFRTVVLWKLPPAEIKSVEINGKSVPYKVSPGVSCIILSLEIEPSKERELRIQIKPLDVSLQGQSSIAEGESLEMTIPGWNVGTIDDRCGVFSQVQLDGTSHF